MIGSAVFNITLVIAVCALAAESVQNVRRGHTQLPQRLVSLQKTEAAERQGGALAAQNAQNVRRGYRDISFPYRKQRLQSGRGALWQPQSVQNVRRIYRNVSFP